MNKRGMTGILIFFMALLVVLFLGLILVIGVGVVDWTADEVFPEIDTLTKGSGDAGLGNISETTNYIKTPLNTFVQAIPGITGALYMMALFGVLGLAYAFRGTQDRWLLLMFFLLTIVTIVCAMVVSIVYEDFYDDNGDFGNKLKEQGLMSFLILYSPGIFTMIALIGAMIMFSGVGGPEI